MNKIRKGDEVIVICGKDKGRKGIVQRRVDAEHVIVEGINQAKKHTKGNPMLGTVGGIINKDMPIHISNVALFNPATNKADKAGIKILEDGRKVRFFKSNNELVPEIDFKTIKKVKNQNNQAAA